MNPHAIPGTDRAWAMSRLRRLFPAPSRRALALLLLATGALLAEVVSAPAPSDDTAFDEAHHLVLIRIDDAR